MKGVKYIVALFMVLSLLSQKQTYSQDNTPFADENVDDLGDVSDEFQEAFFEALKQKGIENYDRAIISLDQCIAIDDSHSILYFEKGKNYKALKNNEDAEQNLLKSLEIEPNQEAVLDVLYDLYYENRDYQKAEGIIKELIPFNAQYKEDLARLYSATQRYDEALALIEELDNEKGRDLYRNQLKAQINKRSGRNTLKKEALNKELEQNAASEQDFLKLIYLYSDQGDTEKAYEAALKLQEINPTSDAVQLALYKIDISKGNTDKAIEAMTRVLNSKKISAKAKHRVLNDFLLFVNENPTYGPQLEAAITTFDSQVTDSNIYKNLGAYYSKKGAQEKALPYLIKALKNDEENIGLLQQVLESELALGKYKEASSRAKAALELYPSQPSLYYAYGVALKELGDYEGAKVQLETGVDYIIDDVPLEANFYEQLGDSYTKLGNNKQARRYIEQAQKLRAAN